MFRRFCKSFFPVQALFSFLCLACAFADLRPIGVATVPERASALLPDFESPAIARFDTEMEKSSVEKAFQIYSSAGVADGELRWEGRALYFSPSVPWKPGVRYGMRLSGTVYAKDGRELPLSKDIPFYAVSYSSLPYVESFFPADGSSTGTADPVALELNFSVPMDRRSAEDALSMDIPGSKIFQWLNGDKTLRLCSDKPLNPWTVYRWSISDKALSVEGAPLAKEASGRFVTDLDREFLRPLRFVPLIPPPASASVPGSALWGSWVPAGISLGQDGLGPGQGIGVEFNKPPESDSLRRAFSFAPSLPGRVELLSRTSAVFIPSKDPEPGTVYSLRVSGALKDPSGLKMGDDHTVSFVSDIPFLEILSLGLGQNEGKDPPPRGGVFSVPVNSEGTLRCVLHFSLPFDPQKPEAREEFAFRISLSPFFPATLPPVSLRGARWLFSDRLLLEWEGLEKGKAREPNFYKLLIPGGKGGAGNGRGSYFKEDFYLYLEAKDG